MSQIRLLSNDPGVSSFLTLFNEGIKLKPNARIGLVNIAIEVDDSFIIIDSVNGSNVIQFKIGTTGYFRNATIPSGAYTQTSLLVAITNIMNKACEMNVNAEEGFTWYLEAAGDIITFYWARCIGRITPIEDGSTYRSYSIAGAYNIAYANPLWECTAIDLAYSAWAVSNKIFTNSCGLIQGLLMAKADPHDTLVGNFNMGLIPIENNAYVDQAKLVLSLANMSYGIGILNTISNVPFPSCVLENVQLERMSEECDDETIAFTTFNDMTTAGGTGFVSIESTGALPGTFVDGTPIYIEYTLDAVIYNISATVDGAPVGNVIIFTPGVPGMANGSDLSDIVASPRTVAALTLTLKNPAVDIVNGCSVWFTWDEDAVGVVRTVALAGQVMTLNASIPFDANDGMINIVAMKNEDRFDKVLPDGGYAFVHNTAKILVGDTITVAWTYKDVVQTSLSRVVGAVNVATGEITLTAPIIPNTPRGLVSAMSVYLTQTKIVQTYTYWDGASIINSGISPIVGDLAQIYITEGVLYYKYVRGGVPHTLANMGYDNSKQYFSALSLQGVGDALSGWIFTPDSSYITVDDVVSRISFEKVINVGVPGNTAIIVFLNFKHGSLSSALGMNELIYKSPHAVVKDSFVGTATAPVGFYSPTSCIVEIPSMHLMGYDGSTHKRESILSVIPIDLSANNVITLFAHPPLMVSIGNKTEEIIDHIKLALYAQDRTPLPEVQRITATIFID
jgi:hypothetical protein